MPYTPYAVPADYAAFGRDLIEADELTAALTRASRHIDILTFNRIVRDGFDSLTDYQKDVIREVVCAQADFEAENEDLISSAVSNYSINGVSVSFGNAWNVVVQDGVAMQRDNYQLLSSTGLCCRLAGR